MTYVQYYLRKELITLVPYKIARRYHKQNNADKVALNHRAQQQISQLIERLDICLRDLRSPCD
jgi:hypothetical protein